MKKVAILMSTYNGEKYVDDQIKSVLNQTYKNITIYIRDDKSKDNTLKIIDKYKNNKKVILLESKKNIGIVPSFIELLKCADNYDYYAFCDQDDIWIRNKIELAVEKLNNYKNNDYLLYGSNYDFYDQDMNFSAKSGIKKKRPTFSKGLFESLSPGMTMVFNNKVRTELLKTLNGNYALHDGWITHICTAFGTVIYDNTVTVKYRRHNNSATKTTQQLGLFNRMKSLLKTFFNKEHWSRLKKQLDYFSKCYNNKLSKKNRKILLLFMHKKTFMYQLKKVFYPVRFKDSIKKELYIRIMFILWLI